MADQGSTDDGGFVAEVNSKFEPLIIEKVCEPILARIPESVHPNSISLTNHLVAWTVLLAAIVSSRLSGWSALIALTIAGVGLFTSMTMDCLDGMQARRTNRCSKLGEMMDHWLDAIHVPFTSAGLVMALRLDPWGVAAVHVTNAMIYNAQLVLYHHTGKFVHPNTSGVDVQFGTSFGYLGIGLLYFFFSRQLYWVDLLLAVIGGIAVVTQVKLCFFYYKRLKEQIFAHLRFVALCCGFVALYLLGAIDAVAFILAISFLSFRITGSYVLRSIVKRPYSGFDWGVVFWIGAIALAFFYLGQPLSLGGYHVTWMVEPLSVGGYSFTVKGYFPYLPYLSLFYMAGRNLIDFARHFNELRPQSAPDREKLA